MAANASIPVYNALSEIYQTKESILREGARWNDLVETFSARYGARPTYVIRAPGRVNILGEHIDYSLFPVLPAAIEQDILLALRPVPVPPGTTPTVDLSNHNPKFKPCSFPLDPPAQPGGEWHVDYLSPADGGGWENYVKVVMAQCLTEFYGSHGSHSADQQGPVGMEVMMSGSVPPGSGLSSSAAVVVGAVIVFLVANNLTEGVSKGDVTRLAIASEHRMGLRTGGMDQAASALALPSALLHLSFFPSLHPVPLPLPSSLAVVIANSLTPHSLTDTAPVQYNLRVVETLCAARILLHALGLSGHARLAPGSGTGSAGGEGKKAAVERRRVWLREVMEMWRPNEPIEGLYDEMIVTAKKVLGEGKRGEEGWSREEMIAESGMSEAEFEETYLQFLPIRAERFHLLPRTLHALQECQRVSRFTDVCRSLHADADTATAANGSSAVSPRDPRVTELGELLSQSHASCRDLYDCTHAQTDELMELCMDSGALGARQTGGGWGGAVISLLPIDRAHDFLTDIKKRYGPYQGLSTAKLEESAFVTMPGCGAGIYPVNGNLS